MVALALAAPEEHGPEVAAWMEQIEPDELPGELLRVVAAVTGGRRQVRPRRRDRRPRDRAPAHPRALRHARPGARRPRLGRRVRRRLERDAGRRAGRDRGRARDRAAAVGGRGLAATGALTGLRGDMERGLALADEAERTLPPGAADGMLAMIESARGLARLGGGDGAGRSRTCAACSTRASPGTPASSRAGSSPTPSRPPCWPTSARPGGSSWSTRRRCHGRRRT